MEWVKIRDKKTGKEIMASMSVAKSVVPKRLHEKIKSGLPVDGGRLVFQLLK